MTRNVKQAVIFCDFDGTITLQDNIIAIAQHFNLPQWKSIVDDTINQRITIRTGVGALFNLFPSQMKQAIIDYVLATAQIRPGFAEMLEKSNQWSIPFYVTSGGIDFFLKPLLQPFHLHEDHIYCNTANFSGDHIQIMWPHPCDEFCTNDCGLCKSRMIRSFSNERFERILIGDSVTDFAGAKCADLIFARSHLASMCREHQLPHHEYETFFDIIDVLQSRFTQEDRP
jgi:2-hydroxy-3-keto-5-methylthiopentenyl-1-phosphate phosphatase